MKKIANVGIHHYSPEVGERKPIVQIEGYRLLFGGYSLATPYELKGQGITFIKEYKGEDLPSDQKYKVGWKDYKVTQEALDILLEDYAVLIESLLD